MIANPHPMGMLTPQIPVPLKNRYDTAVVSMPTKVAPRAKKISQNRGVRLVSTNVIPEYQKWGLGLVIAARLIPEVMDWGIEEVEFSWVLESNKLSYGTLKRGGAEITKRYRIFDYPAPALENSPRA